MAGFDNAFKAPTLQETIRLNWQKRLPVCNLSSLLVMKGVNTVTWSWFRACRSW